MGASGNLKAVGGKAIDPASKAREEHLFNQAQQYATQNPYSQRYGGQVPGMSAMAQAGQQFMANRLLGPGAYQAQNLGFQNYQPQFTYSPMGGGGQPPFTPPGQPPAIDPMATAAPTVAPPTGGDATVGSPGGVGMDQADVVGAVADASIPTATTFGPPPTNQAEIDARAAAMEAEGRRQRGVDTAATAGVPEFSDQGTPQGMPAMDPNAPVRNEAQYSNQFVPNPPPSMSQQPPTGFSDEFGGGPMGMTAATANVPGFQQQGTPQGMPMDTRQSAAPSPEEMGAVMQQQPPGGQPPVPPADGEQFTPASIGGIETVLAQKGPTVTAASALGRPEGEGVSAYMDATGVGSQIESAEQDYQQQLNALQARQAGSGAFGSRGDLEEMGAMGEHLRNIGQIRAAGFDKAAQRMEQDLAREQQATMQEAQLGGQLTGQQLAASQALGQEERATAQALQNMGRDQRDIQQDQMAFDYEQWLRSQEGGGRELAMLQGMLPQAEIQNLAREQGLGSKVFGGLLAGGGLASKFFGGGAV